MAIKCKHCGKDLEVVAYRQLTTYCSIHCARKDKRQMRAARRERELAEKNSPK